MNRMPASRRREQLLDCAADLFAEMGYARATTAQLAKAAGVTEPIIYRHFDSKRDLFAALIERAGRETIELWEQDLADAKDPAERLRRLLADNPMVREKGRSAYRVILQAITEVGDAVIHAALRNHIKGLHAFLVEEIAQAQEEHIVAGRFSAEIISWVLIDVALGYGVLAAMTIPGHGTDAAGNHVQNIIARLLVGKEPKAGEGKD